MNGYQCLVLEVEPALEAGEMKSPVQKQPLQAAPKAKSKAVPANSSASDKTVNLTVFAMSEGEGSLVVGAPCEDPFEIKR